MNNNLEYALHNLKKATSRLKESLEKTVDDLDRDGVIKRFEFTFELFWKTVKALLEYEGFACAGPRSCLKEGARRGFLTDAETILDMLEDRNKTAHIYDEATAQSIFNNIKERYIGLIEKNLILFEKYYATDKKS
jgi:nucleotidyltransferase substrate binding protein (TIGR01987 family)